jgi:hypothetical protein
MAINIIPNRRVGRRLEVCFDGRLYSLSHLRGIAPNDFVRVVAIHDSSAVRVIRKFGAAIESYFVEPVKFDDAGFRTDAQLLGACHGSH